MKKVGKNVSNGVSSVAAGTEISSLKGRRDTLQKEVTKAREKHAVYLKFQKAAEDLTPLAQGMEKSKLEYRDKLLKVSPDDEVMKRAYENVMESLTTAHTSLHKQLEEFHALAGDMDAAKLQQITTKTEADVAKINDRLAVLRGKA